MTKKKLGRGLSALLGDDLSSLDQGAEGESFSSDENQKDENQIDDVSVHSLKASPFQPRTHFQEGVLNELVHSIQEKGVLQPLLVRPCPQDQSMFEIIAGERRWRAAKKANLSKVPVLIRRLNDQEAAHIALIENLQRENLSVIEEAQGYHRLIEEFSHTQEELSNIVGKSRSHVANLLRLISLPESVKDFIHEGRLSSGHGRCLVNRPDALELAHLIMKKKWSVRQTENHMKELNQPEVDSLENPVLESQEKESKDQDILSLEMGLSQLLGLKVSMNVHGSQGCLSIYYENLDQLDHVLSRLSYSSGPEDQQ